ncbi:MAG: hypothetical protein QOK42_2012 [Frankiaceae bacterium]|nr:hypothetical protein [Frankiaceae bacterium]
MQAGGDRAARVSGGERAQPVARENDRADVHRGGDRLIGGAQPAMKDDHDTPTGDRTRHRDHARPRRQNRIADGPGQVDASVAGAVGGGGRVEAADHGRRRREWPQPRGGGGEEGEQQGHAPRLRRGEAPEAGQA